MKILISNIKRLFLLCRIFIHRVYFTGYIRIINYGIKRYILRKKIPMAVMIALTYRCQCNCVHCSVSNLRNNIGEELSTTEVKRVIDEAQKVGALKIGFTGGEPLLRKDIVELAHHAYRRGLNTSIDTNGILLTKTMVVELKVAGISNINVSIDHSRANFHDRLRRNKGCFQKAVTGIKHCVECKVPCVVSTYVTNGSIENGELKRIIALAWKLKASAVRVLFPIYSGKLYERKRLLLSQVNKERFFNSFVKSSFVYSESPLFDFWTKNLECAAERKLSIYLTANGDIKYCYISNESLGSVKKESLFKILNKNAYFDAKQRIQLNCLYCRHSYT